MSPDPDLPLVARAGEHDDRTAVVAPEGTFTYRDLLDSSARVASALLQGTADLREARVAFLAPPGWDYVAVQWGIWRAGGIAVPLAVSHPPAELRYVIEDADASVVVAHPDFAEAVRPVAEGRRFLTTPGALAAGPGPLPAVEEGRRAMMVYTSGTTGRPKGVVTTHANVRAQVVSLIEAWEWSADDRVLLVLPLHHVHGIVNVLTCALWAGAVCEILPRFDADAVWERVEEGELTLFMAVPTIYRRLITAWEEADPERRRRRSEGCVRMRLMVSGSAALPVQTLERWREISGHTLLERYGMTEIGMALSNPLRGERRPGYVGVPLPGVEVRLVDEEGSPVEPGMPGEVEVRGENVFREYWRRPEATAEAFRDGWFRTGDVAVVEDGYYRILGRRSVDIIKTGGYKVSALEIEETLRMHPGVAECAVVGVEDPEWGERICVALETRDGAELPLEELQGWARERLAPYKLPRDLRLVEALPRNAMGKVLKPEVAKLFAS
ncbi:MAG TPA: acyl-CoA synthetase [Longimicrobiaceae bacterium]|nr:acyl-CoA synthetase [Longimicrobiaceae bacterium]